MPRPQFRRTGSFGPGFSSLRRRPTAKQWPNAHDEAIIVHPFNQASGQRRSGPPEGAVTFAANGQMQFDVRRLKTDARLLAVRVQGGKRFHPGASRIRLVAHNGPE